MKVPALFPSIHPYSITTSLALRVTLCWSLSQPPRATEREKQQSTFTLTDDLETPVNRTRTPLYCGRKLKKLPRERTHTRSHRDKMQTPHSEAPRLGMEPGVGEHANRCSNTSPRLCFLFCGGKQNKQSVSSELLLRILRFNA